MNRTPIHEVGTLTQCYDNRALHPISPPDAGRAADLEDVVRSSATGATVVAGPSDVHMRWVDPHGRVTTLGEHLREAYPLVVVRCSVEVPS